MSEKELPLILSLETSTRAGSIALLRGTEILKVKTGCEQNSQSRQLLFDVREILDAAELELKQINLIAAATGPGSFTGLRIGLATAKGLAKVLKTKTCGVSTLSAAAASTGEKNGKICAALSAGRSEYFAQFFEKHEDSLKPISTIGIYKIENLIEQSASIKNLHWIATTEIISIVSNYEKKLHWTSQIMPENLVEAVGKIAFEISRSNETENYPFSPTYVRGADIGGIRNVA